MCPDDIDPAFGNWLAGFTDGEGCFIVRKHGPYGFVCAFATKVRLDDRPILDEIQERTGIGTVRREAGTRWNPQAGWHVHNQADCWSLTKLFDAYPLRAKKARDFGIWREAVLEWGRVKSQGRGGRSYGPRRDWTHMAHLRDELMTGRQYDTDEAAAVKPLPVQFALEIN